MNGYCVSEEDRTEIRKIFNVTNNDVKTQISVLKEWAAGLPQLPIQSQDENFLNIMLLRSKFQIDYAKQNIENYFKHISKYPDVFKKLGKFKPSEEPGVVVVSPIPTSKYERIAVMKLDKKNMAIKKFDINEMILVIVTTGLVMYNNDYVPSVRFLLDFEGFTMLHLLRVKIRDLIKLVYITENILRIRISGIELVNAPRIMSGLLAIAKMLLKPKMMSRITAHSEWKSVYENIPRECLPSDYGGSAQSIEEILLLWDDIIKSQDSYFDTVGNYCT